MTSLDTLQNSIISWLDSANANLEPSKAAKLYQKLILEEYQESVAAPNEAEEYSELMDLLWVIVGYCHYKNYDIKLGLEALVKSNSAKLINPSYDSNGKLMKGSNYVRPDWEQLLKQSREVQ